MKTYTQYGTFSIIVLLATIIICAGLLFFTGFDEVFPIVISGFVILTLLVCLLIFYKLAITVDDTHLSFKMGVGMIKREYLLSDIERCTPVRNSAIWGVGIRMIPSGWLYNVSGSDAIEISFKNSRRKVRIGTDRPEEIAREVSSRIISGTAGSFYEKERMGGMFFPLAVIAAIVIFVVILIVSGRKEVKVTFSDSAITISGMYGLIVTYADILQADTLQILPGIRSRTNGFAAGKVLKGHFKLSDGSKVMLFVTEGIRPYLLIETQNSTVYINFSNPSRTREVYQTLRSRLPVTEHGTLNVEST